jgi:NAD(P)-dependent dehydrogenase (short-subunit alcohol dehydrogenase family)
MSERLAGKVAMVTGAGSGIGEASAKRLAVEGAAVVVTDIDRDAAERVAGEICSAGGRAIAHRVDVSQEEQVAAAVERTVTEWGRLDVLHNSAAATSPAHAKSDTKVGDIDGAFFMRTLEINLLGTLLGCKHALPRMLEAGSGSIINTSSGAGSGGFPSGMTAYGASKAAVESLTRSVAVQYGKRGVRCNAIAPGITLSPTALESMPASALDVVRATIHAPAIADPADQAAVVAYLASDDAAHVNGQVIHTGSGVNIVSTMNAVLEYAASSGTMDPPTYMASPSDSAA